MTTAVILAAGGSSRMGSPKALLPLHGQPVIIRHWFMLAAAVPRVVVVLGADGDLVRSVLPDGAAVVTNHAWARSSPSDSLRLALEHAVPAADRVLVTPVDVAPVRRATLETLLATRGSAVVRGPDGRDGHPVMLSVDHANAVRRRAPDGGLRVLLRGAPRVDVADPLVALDFDTPEAFEALADRWSPE